MSESETITVEPNPFTERLPKPENGQDKKPKSILSRATTRKKRRPIFGVLYGPPGVGKSTFAASSDAPYVLAVERGVDQITVPKLAIESLRELGEALKALEEEDHDYRTVVIDTVDALELLIFDVVMAEGKVKSIEEYGGGYGKGFTRAREYWARLLVRLTALSERLNVLLVAHSHLRTVNDPMLATAYDIHEMKIQQKSAELIRQAVDLILFARLTTAIAKDTSKARKGRGIVTGDREMYTQPTTGLESKNRYNLESPMEFSWAALSEGIAKFYES